MLKTVSSIVNAIGALNYKGTWNAATNNPTLTSSVGVKGDYYVVSVAGTTNLNGESLWGVGDWVVFNGAIWQKVDGGDTSDVTTLTVTSLTGYMYANNTSPVTASTTIPVGNVTGAVPNTVNVLAGTGLSGGGALTGNVTLNIANTTVTSGSYGNASTVATFTVNAQGQLTAAANTTIAIANTQVSGLGTMSTQNSNSVTITGGSISNVTFSNVSINTSIVTKSANYTAAAADETILANSSTGVVTITLPTAVGVAGKVYTVKKIDSSANAVTVATTSSQTIDGTTTYSLANQYGGVNVQSDGSNWYIIANIFGRNASTGTF